MKKENPIQPKNDEAEPIDSGTEIIFEIEVPDKKEGKSKEYYGGNDFMKMLTDLIFGRKTGKKK